MLDHLKYLGDIAGQGLRMFPLSLSFHFFRPFLPFSFSSFLLRGEAAVPNFSYRSKLPQEGPSRTPAAKSFLVHFTTENVSDDNDFGSFFVEPKRSSEAKTVVRSALTCFPPNFLCFKFFHFYATAQSPITKLVKFQQL